ncbi:hypothetical protein ACH5RR_037907 [Cinchona calisaya]|uniref:F-box/LRR-repeat protein 15/At3g58940/PEG3-like LRR domain-containing protein n=1 Tax=Cinchona calisaya TaxID=153742 RepID=A0ABD2Y7J0_9GENT
MHDVVEFEICLSMKCSLALPRSLFDGKTLVVLKLSSNLDIGAPTSICFPNLKILHLHSLACLDDKRKKKIIADCPIPEKLSIKRLVLDKMRSISPCLVFLDLGDYISENYNVIELSQLSEACLSVGQIYIQSIPNDEYGNNLVLNLLCKISNVKHLKLSQHIGKSVACAVAAGSWLCVYRSSTYLEVEVEGSWQFVSDLLEFSPNLEVLVCTTVRRCTLIAKGPHVPCCCTWKPPDSVPSCISRASEEFNLLDLMGAKLR